MRAPRAFVQHQWTQVDRRGHARTRPRPETPQIAPEHVRHASLASSLFPVSRRALRVWFWRQQLLELVAPDEHLSTMPALI